MILNAHYLPDRVQTDALNQAGTDAVAAFIEPMRGTASFVLYRSAARHFLYWLKRRCIPITEADRAIVRRFAEHRCCCAYYSAKQLRDPVYISRVGRFVRFLEDRGDIRVVEDVENISRYLSLYAERLLSLGFSMSTRRISYSTAEHFAAWIRVSRLQWRDVNGAIIERFVRHHCHCSLWRKRGKLSPWGAKTRRREAQRFLAFLKEQGVVPLARRMVTPIENPRLGAFRGWLKQHCGTTDATINRYLHEVRRWLPALGPDPAHYDVVAIRKVVLNQAPSRSRSSVQLTATVLRGYLRFLAVRNECRPELCHAVPSAPHRRLVPLPRYTSPATIERVIASCDATTPARLRDRAIILLLARLGLRAGDIRHLRITDIDWENALLGVHGKGRRTTRLPLPQDAGDAVLAYIEHGRPRVRDEHLFLRVQAPFTPLASSGGVSRIVFRVLARCGIEGVLTGAHLFRHSLATSMLRSGASLESVGTVLRHESPSTTAIYAKVDVPMLLRVAQPWPGDASC